MSMTRFHARGTRKPIIFRALSVILFIFCVCASMSMPKGWSPYLVLIPGGLLCSWFYYKAGPDKH